MRKPGAHFPHKLSQRSCTSPSVEKCRAVSWRPKGLVSQGVSGARYAAHALLSSLLWKAQMFIRRFISSWTALRRWVCEAEWSRAFSLALLLHVTNSFRSIQFWKDLYGAEHSNSTHGTYNVSLHQNCTKIQCTSFKKLLYALKEIQEILYSIWHKVAYLFIVWSLLSAPTCNFVG